MAFRGILYLCRLCEAFYKDREVDSARVHGWRNLSLPNEVPRIGLGKGDVIVELERRLGKSTLNFYYCKKQ